MFSQFTKSQQPAIALEITAGYMLNDQKQKFTEIADSTCDLCGAPDTREHRVLQCPSTEAARQSHAEAIEFLEEYDPVHLHLPLAYVDPEVEFHAFMLHHMPWASLGVIESPTVEPIYSYLRQILPHLGFKLGWCSEVTSAVAENCSCLLLITAPLASES